MAAQWHPRPATPRFHPQQVPFESRLDSPPPTLFYWRSPRFLTKTEAWVCLPAVPGPPPPVREEGRQPGGHHPGRRRCAHLALLLPRPVGYRGVRLLVRRTVEAPSSRRSVDGWEQDMARCWAGVWDVYLDVFGR